MTTGANQILVSGTNTPDPYAVSTLQTVETAAISGIPIMSVGVLHRWHGAFDNSTTVNQTTNLSALARGYCIKMEAEAPFDAVRLVWTSKNGSNAINNCSALVGVTETADFSTGTNASQVIIGGTSYGVLASATSINGWRSVTWNSGGNVVNLPAATTNVTYTFSDWIPLSSVARADGGSRPLFIYRVSHDGSVDGNWNFISPSGIIALASPTPANRNRTFLISSRNDATLVSTPANNVSVINQATTMLVYPQFRYRVPQVSVLSVGDSTIQNDALVTNFITSWGQRGCYDASSQTRVVVNSNMGADSQTSDVYWLRAQELLNTGFRPDVLVIEPASVNDYGSSVTADQLNRISETWRARTFEIVDTARAKGIRNVCLSPLLPKNANTALQDTYRQAFNNFLKTFSNQIQGVGFLTFPVGDGGTPEKWLPQYDNGDGIHPNEYCIDSVMAPTLTTYLSQSNLGF